MALGVVVGWNVWGHNYGLMLRALANLPEDWGLIPRSHIVAQNYL